MRILRTILFYTVFACVILCILLQKITLWALTLGCVLGALFPLFLRKVLQVQITLLPVGQFVRYYLLLCKDMACASVYLCASLFQKERPPVNIAKLKATKHKSQAIRIANSITLTPGTVTLDYEKDIYYVLYLHNASQNKDDFVRIFEDRLGGEL